MKKKQIVKTLSHKQCFHQMYNFGAVEDKDEPFRY